MSRKVLVTGGAGFIGRAVVKKLIEMGDEVVILDDFSGSDGVGVPKPSRMVFGSVCHKSIWHNLPKMDLVIHLAASFANEKSVIHPSGDANTNILGTILAAKRAQEWDCPFIYAGSSSSYGKGRVDVRGFPLSFNEDSPLHPHTPYALSKLTGEHYAKLLHPEGTRILRLFNVFGPGDIPGPFRNAIPNMVLSAEKNGTIPLMGKTSARDFTHIDDVVEVFVKADQLPADVFNVCYGNWLNMETVATIISRVTKATIDVQPARAWDKVILRYGSNQKLKQAMPDFNPREPAPALYHTISWLQTYIKEKNLAS